MVFVQDHFVHSVMMVCQELLGMFNINEQCMLSEYIRSLAAFTFTSWASMHVRFRYLGKNPMRFAVFWRISLRFCGFRTHLTPPSDSL